MAYPRYRPDIGIEDSGWSWESVILAGGFVPLEFCKNLCWDFCCFYITNLNINVDGMVSKFAHDTKIGGIADSEKDCQSTQRDIHQLQKLEEKWQIVVCCSGGRGSICRGESDCTFHMFRGELGWDNGVENRAVVYE